MPFGLVILVLDILLVYHASRTGRLSPWAFIILLVPLVGALAYIVVELIPELSRGPGAQRARQNIASKLDPEKQYRLLRDRLQDTDTIANRAALAAECLALGRHDEAREHYDHILSLPMGHEPAFALGKATAEFEAGHPAAALATLDDLQHQWPDFQSVPAHLLYAKALAKLGRIDEALDEYRSLLNYAPGAEARVRYAQLLDQAGQRSEARDTFAEVVRQMKRSPRYVQKAEAEWISIAEKYLSA